MIYMDNAATTKMRPEVVRAMLPYLSERYANPSGIYDFSKNVKQSIENAREMVAKTIGASSDEIYFTSGGTESDNWAVKIAAKEWRRGNIITTSIEHKAVIKSVQALDNSHISVTFLKPDSDGLISPEQIANAIRPDTFLVSVMTANNEIGTIEPIEKIGVITRKKKILFHTDAVQAYANIPVNVDSMNIDMLSASAHKFNGPKGCGFLYVRKDTISSPFIDGGGQEKGMRAGTENAAGIIGLSRAAQIAETTLHSRMIYETNLRDYMINRIENEIPFSRLNGHRTNRLPNNINFSFAYVEGAALILMLDEQGICASAGSACSSGSTKASHVLTAIGLSDELAHGTVRFTISDKTTRQEIDYTVECLKKDIVQLRKNSESYRREVF